MGTLEDRLQLAQESAAQPDPDATRLLDQLTATLDSISPLLCRDNEAITYIVDEAREDLILAFASHALGMDRPALATLRGTMEGLFSALYYREQSLSLALWARGHSHELVHQFFSGTHEFRAYFRLLMAEPDFARQYPGCTPNRVFDEAIDVYARLSGYTHKSKTRATLDLGLEAQRMLRIFLTFLELTDDITALTFPLPTTYAATVATKK